MVDATKQIRITQNDGTIIIFSPGRYSVQQTPDSNFVTGKGSRVLPGLKSSEERFEGTVNLSNIHQLEIAEVYIPISFRYTAGVIIGGLMVFGLYLIF